MAVYTTAREESEYIPEWDDNRNAADPIKVTLGYWTDDQNDVCIPVRFDQKGAPVIGFEYGNIIKFGVRKIENLTVDDVEITTGVQLNRLSGFKELRFELCTELLDMNQRQNSKN